MAELNRWEWLLRQTAGEGVSQPLRISELCVQMLGVTGAGISLVTDTGNRGVICATDSLSARIEELQTTLGEGPCVDAAASGGPVLVDDLDNRHDLATERWPTFLAAVSEAGVRAVFAFPLRIGAIGIGALDLYRATPGALTDVNLSAALLAAEAAAVALLSLQTSAEFGLVDNVGADTYQAQVHQATGMVMAQLGVTIEQAFLILRARAFANDRPLLAVAVDVVNRRLRFTPEEL